MDPRSAIDNQPSMNLPEPVSPEQATNMPPEQPVKQQGTERNPEFIPPAPTQQTPVQQPSKATLPTPPPTDTAQVSAGPPQQPVVPVATPAIADDLDLIEKEWVTKAKTIVAQTKDDPHKQNQQISAVKDDYIKKRYNKELPSKDKS